MLCYIRLVEKKTDGLDNKTGSRRILCPCWYVFFIIFFLLGLMIAYRQTTCNDRHQHATAPYFTTTTIMSVNRLNTW